MQERTQNPAQTGLRTASRRDVLKGLAMAAVAGAGTSRAVLAESASPGPTAGYPKVAPSAGDPITAADASPVVETAYGRIRGCIRNGIYTFKAIPYGADTSGQNRFMPPQKLAPWPAVRSCLYHGFVSPQPPRTGWKNNEESWLFSWDDGSPSEDCLNLNVWSQGIHDNHKRPVMVWLHGGGYTAGSSTELPSYDGENIARRGDVVLVSVNHRLNVFGFLNLASFGDQYAVSSNVGMLDIVAALEWVRDNIARFGGDPGNVTIFGQSGGGGKVTALMAMPGAKGLFHRAIVESGSLLSGGTMESSSALTQKVLKQLNIGPSDIAKLQQLPFEQIEAASVEVARMRPPASGVIDFRRVGGSMLGWTPVAGNDALPDQPFNPAAPQMSASVPLLVGNTLNEFINGVNKPNAFQMTEDELQKNVSNFFKDKSNVALQTFRAAYPGANNFQLWSVMGASTVRTATLTQARRKAALNAAPVYCYRFDWQTPVLDGRPMAFHCAEIAFVFDNTARCENMTGNGPAAKSLASKVSDAWINFARTGDPNHSGLPRWKPFDPTSCGTMVFDNDCAFQEHLDDDTQALLNES
jgi:para-nitrobenzyl esterase